MAEIDEPLAAEGILVPCVYGGDREFEEPTAGVEVRVDARPVEHIEQGPS